MREAGLGNGAAGVGHGSGVLAAVVGCPEVGSSRALPMPHPPASAAVHHICSMHAPLTRSPSAPPPPSRSVASDLARATGLADAAAAASNRLNKIVQLTGFSDPIYAEAYVTGAAQLPVLPAGVVLCGSQGHLHCSVARRTPMLWAPWIGAAMYSRGAPVQHQQPTCPTCPAARLQCTSTTLCWMST